MLSTKHSYFPVAYSGIKKKNMEKTAGCLLIQMSEIGYDDSQTIERAET